MEFGTFVRLRGGAAVLLVALVSACRNSEPPPRPEPRGIRISGIVEETQDGAPYTYLRIRTADGGVWAAVPLASVRTGVPIQIVNGVALRNFDAPGLARKFDSVVFGVVQR